MNDYKFEDSCKIGDIAVVEVEKYLRSLKSTIDVFNVESNNYFRKIDVNLIHVRRNIVGETYKKIEVKGDTYSHTGNMFLETVSNIQERTSGCFMYTEADYLFYYYINSKELYIIPVLECREWFENNRDRFKSCGKVISTNGLYMSYGFAIPKDIVLKEVSGAKYVNLKDKI